MSTIQGGFDLDIPNTTNLHCTAMPAINPSLRPNFEYTKLDNAQKKRAKCLHCDSYSYAQNATREKEHLTVCQGYQAFCKGTALALKQQKLDDTMVIRLSADRSRRLQPVCSKQANHSPCSTTSAGLISFRRTLDIRLLIQEQYQKHF